MSATTPEKRWNRSIVHNPILGVLPARRVWPDTHGVRGSESIVAKSQKQGDRFETQIEESRRQMDTGMHGAVKLSKHLLEGKRILNSFGSTIFPKNAFSAVMIQERPRPQSG